MQPVTRLKDLGENILFASGKTLEEALQAAVNLAKDRGCEARKYFVQQRFGGTKTVNIIADYVRTK